MIPESIVLKDNNVNLTNIKASKCIYLEVYTVIFAAIVINISLFIQ